jgi:hypothetical protein
MSGARRRAASTLSVAMGSFMLFRSSIAMSIFVPRYGRACAALSATALLLACTLNTAHAQQSDTIRNESNEEITTVGGYGEVHYLEPEGPAKGTLDLARFVISIEHEFSSDISFVSEVEIEHTRLEGGEGGEIAVEQAYLQYALGEHTALRTGLVLLPMGIINEYHEPPSFNGVRRPAFDNDVIPTTNREIGIGVVGSIPQVEGLQYRAYVTSGMHADGFSADEGVLEGRFEGTEPPATSLAFSGRVEYVKEGLRLGGWAYYGGSAAGNEQIASGLFGAPVTMFGGDAQYNIGDLYLRGEAARITIAEASRINEAYHSDPGSAPPIGSVIGGGYIEAAYDVAKLIAPGTQKQLLPFVRWERYNTQSSVPVGATADPANDRTVVTAGLTFKPTYNTVFKADWTFHGDSWEQKLPGELALGMGYNF